MKKAAPYILISVVVGAILSLLLLGSADNSDRKLDERVTFQKRDKIPYGTYVAYENLRRMFPSASVSSDRHKPGNWDQLTAYQQRQALVVISPFFEADQGDMDNLIEFVKAGNDVFVSTMKVSYYVEKMLKCDVNYPVHLNGGWRYNDADSLTISLDIPAENNNLRYTFPGRRYDFWFYGYDTLTSTVIGRNEEGKPNFLKLSAGKGNFYLQLAPVAFTNYFLLHKNNIGYYEKALSLISPDAQRIVWDEYFITRGEGQAGDNDRASWLTVFFRYRSLRWALVVAILALITFVLMEMRRKQRPIPVIHPPKNDSMDFVKTIGRLYHDKGDHRNLCNKMAAYFLEHVRIRYKLQTGKLDEEFVKILSYKTGRPETEIGLIIGFIKKLHLPGVVSEDELVIFHKQLESFYKTS